MAAEMKLLPEGNPIRSCCFLCNAVSSHVGSGGHGGMVRRQWSASGDVDWFASLTPAIAYVIGRINRLCIPPSIYKVYYSK